MRSITPSRNASSDTLIGSPPVERPGYKETAPSLAYVVANPRGEIRIFGPERTVLRRSRSEPFPAPSSRAS